MRGRLAVTSRVRGDEVGKPRRGVEDVLTRRRRLGGNLDKGQESDSRPVRGWR